MSPFNYSFQKILDLKENEKEVAQIQMADAIKQQEDGHRQNEAIYQKISDAEQLKKEKQQKGVHIMELRMLENYIHQLQAQLVTSNRQLMHLNNKVTKSQNHLQSKAKEEKTWMNLKQQQWDRYEEERKVEEQHFFDEMATTRYYRDSKTSLAERG